MRDAQARGCVRSPRCHEESHVAERATRLRLSNSRTTLNLRAPPKPKSTELRAVPVAPKPRAPLSKEASPLVLRAVFAESSFAVTLSAASRRLRSMLVEELFPDNIERAATRAQIG